MLLLAMVGAALVGGPGIATPPRWNMERELLPGIELAEYLDLLGLSEEQSRFAWSRHAVYRQAIREHSLGVFPPGLSQITRGNGTIDSDAVRLWLIDYERIRTGLYQREQVFWSGLEEVLTPEQREALGLVRAWRQRRILAADPLVFAAIGGVGGVCEPIMAAGATRDDALLRIALDGESQIAVHLEKVRAMSHRDVKRLASGDGAKGGRLWTNVNKYIEEVRAIDGCTLRCLRHATEPLEPADAVRVLAVHLEGKVTCPIELDVVEAPEQMAIRTEYLRERRLSHLEIARLFAEHTAERRRVILDPADTLDPRPADALAALLRQERECTKRYRAEVRPLPQGGDIDAEAAMAIAREEWKRKSLKGLQPFAIRENPTDVIHTFVPAAFTEADGERWLAFLSVDENRRHAVRALAAEYRRTLNARLRTLLRGVDNEEIGRGRERVGEPAGFLNFTADRRLIEKAVAAGRRARLAVEAFDQIFFDDLALLMDVNGLGVDADEEARLEIIAASRFLDVQLYGLRSVYHLDGAAFIEADIRSQEDRVNVLDILLECAPEEVTSIVSSEEIDRLRVAGLAAYEARLNEWRCSAIFASVRWREEPARADEDAWREWLIANRDNQRVELDARRASRQAAVQYGTATRAMLELARERLHQTKWSSVIREYESRAFPQLFAEGTFIRDQLVILPAKRALPTRERLRLLQRAVECEEEWRTMGREMVDIIREWEGLVSDDDDHIQRRGRLVSRFEALRFERAELRESVLRRALNGE